jgi:nicotinate dehydrogenase subunit B
MSAPPAVDRNSELDTWVRVDAEGTITVRTGKVELGQGLRAALARIAAEELDVELGRIRVETADTARSPDEGMTVGSMSMPNAAPAMRRATAQARALLVERAAAALDADLDGLVVQDGTVRDPASGRCTSYWEVQGGRPFARPLGEASPKPPGEHRIVGRPGPRIDLEGLVTGTTRFVQDLAPPGVLHARVLRPPSPGAVLEELPACGVDGVTVVRDGSFVGLLAEREEDVVAARDRLGLQARWREQPTLPPQEGLPEWLLAQPAQEFPVVDGVALDDRPVEPPPALPDAVGTLEATYSRPYLLHGSIGPSAALAQLDDDRLTVWTHSQVIPALRLSLAQALGVDPDTIRLVHVPGPGCYGHNGADDAALDAALLACAAPGRPVLVKWTRQDEHQWEPFGAPGVVQTSASLTADGRVAHFGLVVTGCTHVARPFPAGERSALLAAWHRAEPMERPPGRPFLAYHGAIHRNADPIYAFPSRRIVKRFVAASPLRTSSLRSLGAYVNVLAIESTMDELAEAAGADPVAFRLAHLADERAQAVLQAAAERAGWPGRDGGFGRGRGVGLARYKNLYAYAAVIADVTVDDETAQIRVERAVIAADAGEVVDPDGLANQLEGGVVQSASWTLHEQVRFDQTRVLSTDWDSYPILRFSESPVVETVLLDRPGEPFLGAGEATQGPAAAAIANGVYDAIGVRLRDVPFTPARVREAVAAL